MSFFVFVFRWHFDFSSGSEIRRFDEQLLDVAQKRQLQEWTIFEEVKKEVLNW